MSETPDETATAGAAAGAAAAPAIGAAPASGAAATTPAPMKIDAKLGLDVFKLDKEPHIVIDHEICRTVCAKKVCMTVCPADLYELDDSGDVIVNWEGCLECGTCLICCEPQALSWKYPRGEYGVQYRTS
jgi:ferredoxin like protein